MACQRASGSLDQREWRAGARPAWWQTDNDEKATMNYLLIQNAGVAPVESYTLLGMSISRDVEGAIGQFGSGAKHAINVLLRAGLKFYIYCGRTRLEFFTQLETVDDGLTKKQIERVLCKLGGTSTKTVDCGWCLDFGAVDWDDVSMALREFVSNAIDRSIRQGGFVEAMERGDLVVAPCTDVARRAKDGFTRIYIELSKDVQTFFGELPKRFLHFDAPAKVNQKLIPKEKSPVRIYRCGVFVRELEQTKLPSIFDFNFGPNDLSIDESRNSSEYETRGACAKMMRKASADELATVFKSLIKKEQTFESKLDSYYICPSWSDPKTEYKVAWQDGWKTAAGDSAIVESGMADLLQKKGHKVTPIQSTEWVTAAKQFGIKSVLKSQICLTNAWLLGCASVARI